jgi:hypothetical protein
MNEPLPRARSPRVKEGLDVDAYHALRIAEYLRTSVPEKHKVATERVLLKKLSPAAAIKQKCLSCCCYSREEVRLCSIVICPLNPYRPYQGSASEADSDE